MNSSKINIRAKCIWILIHPSAFELDDILISLCISEMAQSKWIIEDHLMKEWGSIYKDVEKVKEIHEGWWINPDLAIAESDYHP